jgi:hypothetical protein
VGKQHGCIREATAESRDPGMVMGKMERSKYQICAGVGTGQLLEGLTPKV